MTFDLERPWRLHDQVALRPEPFGALAYHFGNRRLTFLKTKKLLAVVEGLGEHPSGLAACRAAGVSDPEISAYQVALGSLERSGMVVERVAA
jgi:mycofactocin biosynthesis protein MftB